MPSASNSSPNRHLTCWNCFRNGEIAPQSGLMDCGFNQIFSLNTRPASLCFDISQLTSHYCNEQSSACWIRMLQNFQKKVGNFQTKSRTFLRRVFPSLVIKASCYKASCYQGELLQGELLSRRVVTRRVVIKASCHKASLNKASLNKASCYKAS